LTPSQNVSWKGWAGYIIAGAGGAVVLASAATGVGAPGGIVVGGIMVGVGAVLIVWEHYEAYETIKDADKEFIDPLRKETEEQDKVLQQLENKPKSDPCKEKRK
jgi:hypothetical protein